MIAIYLNKERLVLVANLVLVILISGLFSKGSGVLANSYVPPEFIDDELLLTAQEKYAFDKFKANVWSNITADWNDYIKQDLYLLRWIRAKDLDVDAATQDFFQFLNFLKKMHMHTILKEDFSDLQGEYPYSLDAVDRHGRPILFGSVGDGWNFRRGIIQGKRNRLMRYTYRIVFEALDKVIEVNKKQANVTQFLVVWNMEGFNVFQHSCSSCITTYISLLDVYERYLPGYSREVIVINAPQAYLMLLELLRPTLSPYTRKTLKVFGANKNNWKQYLDARIDPKQLPWEFGGTRNDKPKN